MPCNVASPNVVRIRLPSQLLYSSGRSLLRESGRELLVKVGTALNTVRGRDIRIEGHTDSAPISNARHRSNWSLSVARAAGAVEFLQNRIDTDPTQLVAVGYGEYRPLASNATPEGRRTNRRIEIAVAPRAQ